MLAYINNGSTDYYLTYPKSKKAQKEYKIIEYEYKRIEEQKRKDAHRKYLEKLEIMNKLYDRMNVGEKNIYTYKYEDHQMFDNYEQKDHYGLLELTEMQYKFLKKNFCRYNDSDSICYNNEYNYNIVGACVGQILGRFKRVDYEIENPEFVYCQYE